MHPATNPPSPSETKGAKGIGGVQSQCMPLLQNENNGNTGNIPQTGTTPLQQK